MSAHRCTYQQVYTVSIRKAAILERILLMDKFSKDELRVILLLFTELNGYSPANDGFNNNQRTADPYNFKAISYNQIADVLGIKKKKVEKIIEKLKDEEIIEKGSSDSVRKGWRFTF